MHANSLLPEIQTKSWPKRKHWEMDAPNQVGAPDVSVGNDHMTKKLGCQKPQRPSGPDFGGLSAKSRPPKLSASPRT